MISKLRKKHFEQTLHNNGLDNAWNNLDEQQQGQINQYLLDAANPIEGLLSISEYYPQDAVEFVLDALDEIANQPNALLNTEDFDDNITATVPPCLQNIINDLKTINGGGFGEIIKSFTEKNPIATNFNWNIITATLPNPDDSGTTSSIITNNIATTKINTIGLNDATELFLAQTLIHEAFHAYLVSIYRHQLDNVNPTFVTLLNKYIAQFAGNTNNEHHFLFVKENIINDISIAIKAYGNIKGYNLSQQFCDDMAWGGLTLTSQFGELPQNDQDRINSRLSAEKTNSIDNPEGIHPVGSSPCP